MKTESPFKDRPGFLTFEEFYLLPIGTPVEVVHTYCGGGEFVEKWRRTKIVEDSGTVRGLRCEGSGRFLCDSGLLPYSKNNWNDRNYTRLPQSKPPSELDKLRQQIKAVQETVEVLAAKVEEMSK